MTAKDIVQIVSSIAGVVAVILALGPRVNKTFWLLTTAPQQAIDEHKTHLRRLNDMGFVQRSLESFLYWCRTTHAGDLTWKQARGRVFWCRWIFGHKVPEMFLIGADHAHGVCTRCGVTDVASSEAAVRKAAKKGGEGLRGRKIRVRESENTNPSGVAAALRKLADELEKKSG